jgi:hypothetical protein
MIAEIWYQTAHGDSTKPTDSAQERNTVLSVDEVCPRAKKVCLHIVSVGGYNCPSRNLVYGRHVGDLSELMP